MEYNYIDKVLNATLSPEKYPSKELNDKIMSRIKESGKMKQKNKNYLIAACIIICVLLIPTSIYAAYKYLLPKDIAREFDDIKLGDAFDKYGKGEIQRVTDGAYTVTYLGHVTGESISERSGSAWELHPERTYVAVAIEKTDGTEITLDNSLFVSPLIQGLQPWRYNIATMNGSYQSKIIDGILYRIIECDNIEIFADRELYLAVSNTLFYSVDAFNYDEDSGMISVNEDYEESNILFELELDPTKADSEKVETYLKQLEEEWNPAVDNNEAEVANEIELTDDIIEVIDKRVQQEVFTDNQNDISIHIKDNESPTWWAYDDSVQTVFDYSFEVKGDGIETLTYILNKGEFCYYPSNPSEREFYGNTYSIPYDEQEKLNYHYAISFKADFTDYGYESHDLGVEHKEMHKIYRDILNQEVESTNMILEIKMEDGRVIEKTFSFDNLLKNSSRQWIAISLD